MHDRNNIHEGHLYDIIADHTESPADARALEARYRSQPGVDRTMLLADVLLTGLSYGKWPWSNRQTCPHTESRWTADKDLPMGRRLELRYCHEVDGHDGEHVFGEWCSR